MDEKTEDLRDIFMEVADDETVTEEQEETHGSLSSDQSVDERLSEVISSMKEDLDFSTTLSVDELVTIVRGFYAGNSDTEIARELGDASRSKTVARARIDLHLLRDSDTDAPFDLDTLREYLEKGLTLSEMADRLEVSESTVRRYKHVIETQLEIRQVNDQYRNEFENILQDRELAEHFTENVREDGLSDATEGQETDVSL